MTEPTDRPRVLVVDDEPQIRRLLEVSLGRRGYRVESAARGIEGIERLAAAPFDLLLLDLGLPDLDGLEVCRLVRAQSPIPIIVVSVREGDPDKVAALDLGADDYVTKPFSMEELLARMRASLRRAAPLPEPDVLALGPVTLDIAGRRVTKDGEAIHLTPTEYDLLHVLAANRDRVMTHRQLLRRIRGPAYEEDTSILRVHIAALRQKLGIGPGTAGYITTEPGIGYRLLGG
ncbi:MAG TPA: response regulator transcription factor [Chloroflexota bacterium]|nr:response regulator transcription factor [Chloroflexota bacterium]